MEAKDTEHPEPSSPPEDDRDEEQQGSPVPDPEEERGTARDDPQAD